MCQDQPVTGPLAIDVGYLFTGILTAAAAVVVTVVILISSRRDDAL